MANPVQIAGVLEKGANLRFDIKRAKIMVARDAPHMLLFKIANYTEGTGREGERNINKINQDDTVGKILSDWLGPEPAQLPTGRDGALVRERAKFFGNTIDRIVELQSGFKSAPTYTTPKSKLPWKKADTSEIRNDLPRDILPKHGPDGPTAAGGDPNVHPEARLAPDEYRDDQGQIKKKMTRPEMIKAKMTRLERHSQYRFQGGKHPSETK